MVTRLGRNKREGFKRPIKIRLQSKEERDKLLMKAPKLKNVPTSAGKFFVKKDEHQVYEAENTRIYKKMSELKKVYDSLEIKIKDGKLYVGGPVVDKNRFFIRCRQTSK